MRRQASFSTATAIGGALAAVGGVAGLIVITPTIGVLGASAAVYGAIAGSLAIAGGSSIVVTQFAYNSQHSKTEAQDQEFERQTKFLEALSDLPQEAFDQISERLLGNTHLPQLLKDGIDIMRAYRDLSTGRTNSKKIPKAIVDKIKAQHSLIQDLQKVQREQKPIIIPKKP